MRARPLLARWSAVLLALAVGAAPAAARKRPKPGAPMDVSAYRDQLFVLTDDDGRFLVIRDDRAERTVWVGDGRDFYEQDRIGSGSNGTNWTLSMWAPRSRTNFGEAHLSALDGRYRLDCGESVGQGEEVPELRRLPPADAAALLAKATFRTEAWDRKPRYLARDDSGTYYYVDQLAARGAEGFRVFVGRRGKMKEVPMKSVVVDSAGDIFATKRGELRIVLNQDRTAVWIKGKKRTALTVLPTDLNHYVIYRDLGIYGFLGTACDDY